MARGCRRAAQHRHRLGGNRRRRASSRSERFDRRSTASTESRSVAVPYPRPRPRRLLCRRLWHAPRGASPSPQEAGRRQVTMAAVSGSSHSIRVLSGSPQMISPARRHGSAWQLRPRLSRQTLSSDVTAQAAVLAAPPDVLLVSTNRGSSWRPRHSSGPTLVGRAVLPDGGGLLHERRGARGKPNRRFLIRTSDGGLSWAAGPKAPAQGVSAGSLVRASSSASRSVGRQDWR